MNKEIEIIKKIAIGGQKEVFLASHKKHGLVVVKKGGFTRDSTIERIKREVNLLNDLNLECFPKQFEFNIDESKNNFVIIEEFIEGEELFMCKNRFRSSKDILALIERIIDSMNPVWEMNIVHRDLKPQNILIKPDGNPTILDFGIARFRELDSLTNSFFTSGPHSPGYSAPEQLQNLKRNIDIRADFFSIGVIALELFLGKNPFSSDLNNNKNSIEENILSGEFKTLSETVAEDEVMTALAYKTIENQPFNRFRNYKQFKKFIINRV
jgi:serine/threonine-protein kinase